MSLPIYVTVPMVILWITVFGLIIYNLFLTDKARDKRLLRRFKLETIEDMGIVYTNNVVIGFETHSLLKGVRPNGDVIYIIDAKKEGKAGLGHTHKFQEINSEDANALLKEKSV